MTLEEELAQLRAYKEMHQGRAINRAFGELHHLLEQPTFDPIISRRAFRVIAECLILLREETNELQR